MVDLTRDFICGTLVVRRKYCPPTTEQIMAPNHYLIDKRTGEVTPAPASNDLGDLTERGIALWVGNRPTKWEVERIVRAFAHDAREDVR